MRTRGYESTTDMGTSHSQCFAMMSTLINFIRGSKARLRKLGTWPALCWRFGDFIWTQVTCSTSRSNSLWTTRVVWKKSSMGTQARHACPVLQGKSCKRRASCFSHCTMRLGDHYSKLAPAKRLFNMTIKAHYLAHTILQSQWLNPKLGWCYSGEDFMQHTRRLMHRCTVGNTAERAGVKFASQYRIGLHCILQRST